jgi:protein-disulfide isomerase
VTNGREERATRAEQMRKDRERAEKRQRNLITVGIVGIVVVLIAVAAVAFKMESDKRELNTKLVPPAGATKDYGVVYAPKDAGGTAKKDVVRVVIYEDMQCPICQRFEQANGQYLAGAVKSGEIEVEYRFVAFLDDLGASPNEYSRRASNAVLCAREEGGPKEFKQMHDLLYANQPEEKTFGPEDAQLVESAVSVGVKQAAAESCILKRRYVPWLEKATEAMSAAKVSGTPTVRVNGKDVKGAGGSIPTMVDIQKAVDAAKK